MRLLVALVVWAAAVAGAIALSSTVASSVGSSTSTTATSISGAGSVTQTTTEAPSTPFDASSVKPTDPRSLFVAANLRRALSLVRAHAGADPRVELLRLAAGNLIVMLPRGARENQVIVGADGSTMVQDIGPATGAPTPLFRLSRVRPEAPAAIAARIARTGRMQLSQLNYMVADADPIDATFRWLVYPVGGGSVHFEAATATGPITEYSPSGAHKLSG